MSIVLSSLSAALQARLPVLLSYSSRSSSAASPPLLHVSGGLAAISHLRHQRDRSDLLPSVGVRVNDISLALFVNCNPIS